MRSLLTYRATRHSCLCIIFLTVIVGVSGALGQDASSELKESVIRSRRDILKEKAYVHTDKDFYVAGELMWMKAYLVDAYTHAPVGISKVGYLELMNAAQQPMLQLKVEMLEGKGAGSLFLPPTLPGGNYTLRFYTSWMKNFPAEGFYEKQITIVNTLRAPASNLMSDSNRIVFRFFPEGGSLVDGLPSKLAFTATDAFGNAVTTNAAIVDNNNDTIGRLSTGRLGMGSIEFTPASDRRYRVVHAQSRVEAAFPEILSSGYSMQLHKTGGALKLSVHVKKSGLENNIPVVYLLAHSGKEVMHASMLNISSGSATINLDTSILRNGINYFTIFDYARKPVAERLYFKMPSQRLVPSVSISGSTFKSREKVEVAVSNAVEASETDFSVSVYKVPDSTTLPSDDIFSYLWLNSELNAFTHFPSIYFSSAASTEADLDHLMLTSGWRQFDSANAYTKKASFRFLPEVDGHLLTGKVVDSRTGRAQAHVAAFLSIPGVSPVFLTSTSDSGGTVRFHLRDHHGPGELILQTDYRRDSMYRVDITSPFATTVSRRAVEPMKLSSGYQEYVRSLHLGMQVQTSFAAEELRTYVQPPIDTTPFFRSPDYTYYLDDYKRFTTMEEVLREYVPGVIVRRREGRFKVEMISILRKEILPEPLILLDGVPIFSSEQVLAYDPLKVRKLQVVMKRYYYGPALFTGITSFSTYGGDLAGFTPDPRAVVIDYEGLQLQRKFYSPVYDNADQRNSRTPDYRTVLQWSPFNAIRNGEKAKLNFFTSDQPGQYIIVVHGLSKDGVSGSAIQRFEVRE